MVGCALSRREIGRKGNSMEALLMFYLYLSIGIVATILPFLFYINRKRVKKEDKEELEC